MKNADQPAFAKPSMRQDGEQNRDCNFDYRERGSEGLTKREYFAVHAPEAPEWFVKYAYSVRMPNLGGESSVFDKKFTKWYSDMFRAWRYYYADMMLAEEPVEGNVK